MTLVVDASVVVAALIDDGVVGSWAEASLRTDELAAPVLMPIEAANILRRASMFGQISSDTATLAHADLCPMPVVLFPYVLLAGRAWSCAAMSPSTTPATSPTPRSSTSHSSPSICGWPKRPAHDAPSERTSRP